MAGRTVRWINWKERKKANGGDGDTGSSREHARMRKALLLAGVCIVVLAGIILPGQVLAIREQHAYDQVEAVPEQYLATNSAMTKNASMNLKMSERLRLISGQWESQTQEAGAYEMEQENYEAIVLLREGMNSLYHSRQYPVNLSSEYSNWYTWTAQSYKAVDTTFHTYAAYYWIVHFEKYDGRESHTIWMLDDGTIFLAEAVMPDNIDSASLSAASAVMHGTEEQTITALDMVNMPDLADIVPYEDVSTSGLTARAWTQVESGEDSYQILQLYGGHRYLYVLTAEE
ncbi:MAG: hypothetical protein K2O73_04655 [Lachnospiraceae bacterium]|nr:hypothetical protein [Lachnospiraceae bacterium]